MKHFELIRLTNDSELATAVAVAWWNEVNTGRRNQAQQCVALSGGRIARKLFSEAAQQAVVGEVKLDSVHFFWADERGVPPSDPESNFQVARELLFAPLHILDEQIHRIQAEEPPDVAATKAEREISGIAPLNSDGQPVLDLIFLGMGEDGHVASLFPGEPESVMSDPAVYRAVTAGKPPPQRITIGYKTIAAARQVWVLASGPGKETALRNSLSLSEQTPLARVLKSRTFTKIFTDIPFE